MGAADFPMSNESSHSVKLTPHHHWAFRLIIDGAVSPLPLMSSWRGASLGTGTMLSLPITILYFHLLLCETYCTLQCLVNWSQNSGACYVHWNCCNIWGCEFFLLKIQNIWHSLGSSSSRLCLRVVVGFRQCWNGILHMRLCWHVILEFSE
jgi:hypothetical protein